MKDAGEIFFDGTCGLCTASYRRFGPMTERRGFRWSALQEPHARELLRLAEGELPGEMKLRRPDGTILGGVDALLHVARHIWWAWPAWFLSCVPGVKPLLRITYRWLARNRHKVSNVCRLPAR
jgi:predicted DCC family thiol-disulfide oxidoreductase YuxK